MADLTQTPDPGPHTTLKKLLVLLVLVAGVAAFYLSGLHRYFTWEAAKTHRDAWRAWVDDHWLPAAAGFFLLYVAVTGLSIPVGWVLTVTAGALFGFVGGAIFVSFASTTGATLAFVLCRYVFRDFARRHLGRWLATSDRGVARDGALFVILLRLTPLVPFWAVNASMALTSLPVRTFWWASQIGMLPVSLLYVYIGTELARIESPRDVLSPGLLGAFAAMAVLPLVLRRAPAIAPLRTLRYTFNLIRAQRPRRPRWPQPGDLSVMPPGDENADRASLPRPRCRSLLGFRVLATGSYVPDAVVTNDHLFERFGFDSDWIVKRTGIYERRHALPHQATSDLCLAAVNQCIERAGVRPQDIDLLLVGTFTPDYSFPSTACILQDKLKLICPAVDLQAACAGFMYALITGAAYVVSGASDLCLVVGGDCNSRILNPADIKTYPLFGDGAGAFLIGRGRPDQGILAYSMGADGSGGDQLIRYACGSRRPPTPALLAEGQHYMYMDGRAVFRWAVAILNDTIQDVLTAAGMRPADVDLYVPHQANIRIINAACDTLKIPRQRVYTNLDRYGNTSAGSIPLAVDEAVAEGKLGDGRLTVLSGFGAGLTWGTALMRW